MTRWRWFTTLMRSFERDIGIDLGTANTLVHVAGQGVVLNEPSVVAVNRDTGEPLAVGEDAKRMLGRTPANIIATRPLKDGVIADYDLTEKMLQDFIHKVSGRYRFRRSVVVGLPYGVTEVERRAVIQAARRAGATQAFVIEEPMAAAIGAGLPIEEPKGSMIVDIGGGTTEVAMISLSAIVEARSIRVAGDEIDERIMTYVRNSYNLAIGERMAEETKIDIGSAYPLEREIEKEIRGRDLRTGLPRSETVHSDEIRYAIQEPLQEIIEAVKRTLEVTPPELAADAIDRGIALAGGGALLRGLDRLLAQETGMPVFVANDPLRCVVLGTGKVVEEMHANVGFRRMLERSSKF